MIFSVSRGLIKPWKQVVYFDFDSDMKKNLLLPLIRISEEYGCKVRGFVCDMGNKALLRELGVKINKWNYFIPNPVEPSRSVYIFPDMPHCIKLLRNHTLDEGMVIKCPNNNTVYLNKDHFLDLISSDGDEWKLVYKVSLAHLEVRGMERQRVRPAMQLFSHTVSQAFLQVFGKKYVDQSKIIERVDAWVDVMNSRQGYDWKKNRCGLGENEI